MRLNSAYGQESSLVAVLLGKLVEVGRDDLESNVTRSVLRSN